MGVDVTVINKSCVKEVNLNYHNLKILLLQVCDISIWTVM